jgi:hypothetical protein
MTRGRELDDVLREWVDHGAERLPQHNLAAALAQIETTPQRGVRMALLEGLIMRFQPLAVPVGIAVLLVLTIGAYALVGGPLSVGPSPSPSGSASAPAAVQTNGQLSTASFADPVTVTLPSAPDPAGWFVSDGSAMVTIAAVEDSQDRLVIVDPAQARIVNEDGGSEALPDDLVAWLDDQPGITAEPLPSMEGEGQATHVVNGRPVPIYAVTAESAGGEERAVVDTPIGPALSVTDAATTWWLLHYESEGVELLLIATSERDAAQGFRASYFQMIESITLP